jgi:hypothetical protein
MRPHSEARADGPDAMLKAGFELALALVGAAENSGSMTWSWSWSWFEHAAARCAEAGIPIETVHDAVYESVETALAQADPMGEAVGCTWDSGAEPGQGQRVRRVADRRGGACVLASVTRRVRSQQTLNKPVPSSQDRPVE